MIGVKNPMNPQIFLGVTLSLLFTAISWGAPLEFEAKFGDELNGGINVFYHDADVVHTLDRHDASLASKGKITGVCEDGRFWEEPRF
ncbi:MAG: hypothetical protein R3B37_08075 [Nitrospira sp.]|nr:hypothetical protein [Nitrospira sp.]